MIANRSGATAAAQRPVSFGVAVGLLAFANFVIVTSEFVMVGMLPSIARDFGITLGEAGRLVTWFALAAAFVGPPLTILAGHHEPRRVFLLTTVVVAVANLAAALAPNYAVLTAARVVQGCALPVFVSVASVAAAELAGAGRTGWAVSLVNAGVVATTVLGVPAGALVATSAGWPVVLAGLAVLGFASVALIAFGFPRIEIARPPRAGAEVSLLWQPGFLLHLLLSGILFTAMFASYTYIAALFAAVAGLDGAMTAWALMGFGAAGIVGNWLAGRVVDRDPLAATMGVAVALTVAMAAIAPAGGGYMLFVLLVALWGTAHMAAFVISQVRVMAAGPRAPAFAMSLNISVCNLGIALGATLGGWIVDRYGVAAAGYGGAGLAVVALLIAVAMAYLRSRPRTSCALSRS